MSNSAKLLPLVVSDEPREMVRLEELGDRLRRVRELRGWGQDQMAEAMGVSRQAVSSYEVGKAEPRWWAIVNLVERLHIPFDVLAADEVDWHEVGRTLLDQRLAEPVEDLLLGPSEATPAPLGTDGDGAHSSRDREHQEPRKRAPGSHILGGQGAGLPVLAGIA
jgi:transcriptional regulator with XRE-family HTH domain